MTSQDMAVDPEDRDYSTFQTDGRNTNPFPQSLGVLPSVQTLGRQISSSLEFHQAPTVSEDCQTRGRTDVMNLIEAEKEIDHRGQRPSLTLGSHLQSHVLDLGLPGSNYVIAGEAREVHNPQEEYTGDDSSYINSSKQNQSCSSSYETESFAAIVGNSRYLMPAQSLLEEVVSVGGKAIDIGSDKFIGQLTRNGRRGALGVSPELHAELYSNKFSSTTKDELQIRITQLIALLDEVERRYEKYYHQMEEVVSSFEVIAGLGAAKSYTALPLHAMSRRFCSLRAAIITQIYIAKREFSQDLSRISNVLSQLCLFDQEIRHTQAALQPLGMTQNQQQPRRPPLIRGLPENAVGFLRTWLFEHFLHPYPSDSEKLMLASQTGLTKNQVSNWFINARVRLWKPMIEEMFKEEFAESSMDSSPSESLSTTSQSVSNHAGN